VAGSKREKHLLIKLADTTVSKSLKRALLKGVKDLSPKTLATRKIISTKINLSHHNSKQSVTILLLRFSHFSVNCTIRVGKSEKASTLKMRNNFKQY